MCLCLSYILYLLYISNDTNAPNTCEMTYGNKSPMGNLSIDAYTMAILGNKTQPEIG